MFRQPRTRVSPSCRQELWERVRLESACEIDASHENGELHMGPHQGPALPAKTPNGLSPYSCDSIRLGFARWVVKVPPIRESPEMRSIGANDLRMSHPTTTPPTSPTTTPTTPESRLAALGHTLPTPAKPVAAYVPTRRSGNLVYVSGQIPFKDGQLIAKGAVPGEVSLETARACAQQCCLNALAAIKAEVGELSRVKQVVRVGVFVCSQAGFYDQPKVANGASELLEQVFGEAGKHARAAVGSIALPLGAPVEVEVVVEVG
jgi:enamine deaminase RidA (YjgF/YER057c/UK114 family)